MNALTLQTGKRSLFAAVIISLIYLQGLLILDKGFTFDRQISDMFFDFTCHAKNARECWLLDKSNKPLTFFLHNLPVDIFTAVGIFSLCVLVAGFRYERFKPYRELSIVTLIGLIAVPGIVAYLKATTGHFCPGQLSIYGGPVGTAEAAQPRPRCFPAGFPAGGFSFLVIYFGALPPRWRRMGLYTGLGIGGISSIIQIARGEHFLSHCLATLMTALFVGMLLSLLNGYRQGRPDALTDD